MSRFKTELCNNLIELGTCKYGDRCHYAHGAHELRQVSRRHPKYRTEKCKNFELTGKCPFGPRCSYVHPKPDLDSMIDQLTKYMKHTKAPKPDSEDDDDVSLTFTRTNTSISTCDSMLGIDDENKENNQRLFNTSISHNTQALSSSSSSLTSAPKLLSCSKAEQLFSREVGSSAGKQQSCFPLQLKNNSLSSNLASIGNRTHLSALQVNSQAPVSSNNSNISTRTPLADTSNTQNRHILTPLNLSNRNNFQAISSSDQVSITKAAYLKGTNSTKSSLYEATSYESNKKLRLSDIDSSTSNTNNTISYPFAIRNPLSDYLNITRQW